MWEIPLQGVQFKNTFVSGLEDVIYDLMFSPELTAAIANRYYDQFGTTVDNWYLNAIIYRSPQTIKKFPVKI